MRQVVVNAPVPVVVWNEVECLSSKAFANSSHPYIEIYAIPLKQMKEKHRGLDLV